MDTFIFYIELGFWHVIDLAGLDHFFFITTLAVPFAFSQSRKLLWWVTLFTLGHTFSLMGNVYAEIIFSPYWIELLIPVTIALSAISLLFNKGTSIADKTSWFFPILTIIFGIIHGLGFGRYFSIIIPDGAVGNSLFSFALGVELAQVLIVLGVLVVNIMVINIMKRSRSKWEFLVGAMVLSQAMTMIFERI
ncbi:MAG: HupE / UreJ protein [Flavobacteriaceae bacterium]|nr:HupE / UreJ protein [Flavobacteriaceae bacterium]